MSCSFHEKALTETWFCFQLSKLQPRGRLGKRNFWTRVLSNSIIKAHACNGALASWHNLTETLNVAFFCGSAGGIIQEASHRHISHTGRRNDEPKRRSVVQSGNSWWPLSSANGVPGLGCSCVDFGSMHHPVYHANDFRECDLPV